MSILVIALAVSPIALELKLAATMAEVADAQAEQPEPPKDGPAPSQAKKAPVAEQPGDSKPAGKLSDAEIILRLQKAVQINSRRVDAAKKELNDPNSEYRRAEASFRALDRELRDRQAEIQKLKATGKTAEAGKLDDEIKSIAAQRELALTRFNLALKEYQILEKHSVELELQVRQAKEAIAQIQGGAATTALPAAPAAASDDLNAARDNAAALERAYKACEEKLQTIDRRLDTIRGNIDIENQLLDLLREREKNANDAQAVLQRLLGAQKAKSDLAAAGGLEAEFADAKRRGDHVRNEVAESTQHLAELRRELAVMEDYKGEVQKQANAAKKAAAAAEDHVKYLENPIAPPSIWRWLKAHGPKLVFIIVGMIVFQLLVRQVSQRIIGLMTRHRILKSDDDRQNRAETLVGVFRKTMSLVVLIGGTLMILDSVNIPVVPLLGSAAVVGLAVAFGAQSLIKDYFTGFMILLEDQYGINDVVKIGDAMGKVEKITLRMTVLRDIEGAVHFIPHGTIATVSNFTHRWSRAFFEVTVGFKENVDRVIDELHNLCIQLRDDSALGPFILDKPEMLGVDQLQDKGVVIKFFLRTNPLGQWNVKRELLRRIVKRFGELGIEFAHA
jgi:moderate conductance mechanosensitive channel